MQFAGFNVVDSSSIRKYYRENGLNTQLIDKCSAQEFKFINGFGMGYFLMTENINTEFATFTWDNRTVSLRILEKQSLEEIGHSGGLYLYTTAEPKYELHNIIVSRNFNITIDKSLSTYGATATINLLAPDEPPKTLEQVFTEIATGYTINWFTDEIVSFDINIEGFSVLTAIDTLCSIYGMIWSVQGADIYVWDADANQETSDLAQGSATTQAIQPPYNDINHSLITEEFPDVNVVFPIYDYCREDPRERYVYSSTNSGQGRVLNVYDPYYPAVVSMKNGPVVNQGLLDARGALIAENLRGIGSLIDYLVYERPVANPLSTQPLSLSEIHGDFGSGPRSIFRTDLYPTRRVDYSKSDARLADNWVGTLTDGYFGEVFQFSVTPLYGLDGCMPEGVQAVFNLYNWCYGEPGWTIRVEWDCVNSRWIPLQQEFDCPPGVDPGYPVTPPENPWPLPEGGGSSLGLQGTFRRMMEE